MDDRIRSHPNDPSLYFSRHQAWDRLGRLDLALADVDTALRLDDKPVRRLVCGEILFRLGRYREALDNFRRGEALDPQLWREMSGPLYEAECHLYLGDGAAALAACARLPDTHWSPGLWGTARGNKDEITADITRRIAEGRPDPF